MPNSAVNIVLEDTEIGQYLNWWKRPGERYTILAKTWYAYTQPNTHAL